jgi:hypothetical protein
MAPDPTTGPPLHQNVADGLIAASESGEIAALYEPITTMGGHPYANPEERK